MKCLRQKSQITSELSLKCTNSPAKTNEETKAAKQETSQNRSSFTSSLLTLWKSVQQQWPHAGMLPISSLWMFRLLPFVSTEQRYRPLSPTLPRWSISGIMFLPAANLPKLHPSERLPGWRLSHGCRSFHFRSIHRQTDEHRGDHGTVRTTCLHVLGPRRASAGLLVCILRTGRRSAPLKRSVLHVRPKRKWTLFADSTVRRK